jgi:signal transduction histidine kinase
MKIDISERLHFLDLDEEACQILRELKPVLEAEMPEVLQRFHDSLERCPQVNALFGNNSDKVRVRKYQLAHWRKLLSANFDDEFLQSVHRVAKINYRMGLKPQWYIGGHAYIIGELVTIISRNYATGNDPGEQDRRDAAVKAFIRAALLDMELAISVWLGEGEEAVKKERKERRWTEARLTEEASDLEAALGESEAFSYSVSHDLRAPLRSIDGFSHALEEDYADRLDETGKDYLARVRQSAARMGHLIDDLLKLSRLSRASILPDKVDLSAMAHEILQTLKEADPKREIEVRIEPDLNEECDPRLTNIVLTNLLENACKYTRLQPHAQIEFGRVQENGEAAYFVRDNGVGFDMAYANKLFKPFQRLHSIQDFPGTGIGLATVAMIIQRHGGQIWVQSEPDKGTTFKFVISDHSWKGNSHDGQRPDSPGRRQSRR